MEWEVETYVENILAFRKDLIDMLGQDTFRLSGTTHHIPQQYGPRIAFELSKYAKSTSLNGNLITVSFPD